MTESDRIRVTRWIDGELADQDVSDLLERHPELPEEKRSILETGKLLRQQLLAGKEVPYPDFLNSEIERRIGEDPYESDEPARLFPTFERMKWIAFAGTLACVAVLGAKGLGWFGASQSPLPWERSLIVSTYAPNAAHSVAANWVEGAAATVITISGLEAVPVSTEIIGFSPARSQRDGAIASTTFFSTDDKPILVLTTNSLGEPRLHPIDL